MSANPYASGMPDVFSAVFGASPEVGAQAGDEGRAPVSDAAALAAPRMAEREARADAKPTALASSSAKATAATAAQASAKAADASRTMAESNPWLIDHARRIAAHAERAGGARLEGARDDARRRGGQGPRRAGESLHARGTRGG
jgi:flagellar biosynthesis protein FlhF